MIVFAIVAAILFFLLFLIWNGRLWLNFFIKVGLLAMSLWGAFLALRALGYIVKM